MSSDRLFACRPTWSRVGGTTANCSTLTRMMSLVFTSMANRCASPSVAPFQCNGRSAERCSYPSTKAHRQQMPTALGQQPASVPTQLCRWRYML